MPDRGPFKLVVILAEPELETQLAEEILALGARGYARLEGAGEWRRGRGREDAPGPHDWKGAFVRLETVVPERVARAILDRLAERYFENYAVFAYLLDAQIARPGRYA